MEKFDVILCGAVLAFLALVAVDVAYAPSCRETALYASGPVIVAWNSLWAPPGAGSDCSVFSNNNQPYKGEGVLRKMTMHLHRTARELMTNVTLTSFCNQTGETYTGCVRSAIDMGKSTLEAMACYPLAAIYIVLFMSTAGFMSGTIALLLFALDIVVFTSGMLVLCVQLVVCHPGTALLACVLTIAVVGAARRM